MGDRHHRPGQPADRRLERSSAGDRCRAGPPFCTAGGALPLTGAWSTYWYNGFLYETHIGEGLNIFKLSGNTLARRIKLDQLNPQTQEFSLPD